MLDQWSQLNRVTITVITMLYKSCFYSSGINYLILYISWYRHLWIFLRHQMISLKFSVKKMMLHLGFLLYSTVCCLIAKLCLTLFATPWAVACQAPLSMWFPRQEYWSRLPFPSPGDLPVSGIEPRSPALAEGFFTTKPSGNPLKSFWKLHMIVCTSHWPNQVMAIC